MGPRDELLTYCKKRIAVEMGVEIAHHCRPHSSSYDVEVCSSEDGYVIQVQWEQGCYSSDPIASRAEVKVALDAMKGVWRIEGAMHNIPELSGEMIRSFCPAAG